MEFKAFCFSFAFRPRGTSGRPGPCAPYLFLAAAADALPWETRTITFRVYRCRLVLRTLIAGESSCCVARAGGETATSVIGSGNEQRLFFHGGWSLEPFAFHSLFALAGQVGGPGRARPTFFRTLPLMGFDSLRQTGKRPGGGCGVRVLEGLATGRGSAKKLAAQQTGSAIAAPGAAMFAAVKDDL